MIKYKLICKDCESSFDSWFASSKEYEKLKKMNHINCHECGSLKVEKSLMSPNVLNSKKINLSTEKNKKYIKVRNKIKEYQKFIKKNFNYVGDSFVHEARTLQYDSKKKPVKGIYGKASSEEIAELKDEGIEIDTIPWFNDNEN